jgi:hypothetical protein
MANEYFSLKSDEQKEILRDAALNLGMRENILEKDIWLCWVLQTLFSIPNHHRMAFKGGTSLSKVYKMIDRFSEDVDITLDYRQFDNSFDPFAEGVSRSQIGKFCDQLKTHVKNYVDKTILPTLEDARSTLHSSADYEIRVEENGEKVWFSYPSAVEDQGEYLRSDVLIEFGGRNVIDPNEVHVIGPDIAPLTDELKFPQACVTVLSPLRTFWEKATLIHVECNRGRLKESPDRLSRHWYDLTRLNQHEVSQSAVDDRRLFEDVVKHKKIFFHASYAKYDDCLAGRLRLLPDGDDISGLKDDYKKMVSAEMIYGEVPEFDEIIEKIRDIESRVNQLGKL